MRKEQKYFRELAFIISQQSFYIILCSLESNFCNVLSASQFFFFFFTIATIIVEFLSVFNKCEAGWKYVKVKQKSGQNPFTSDVT